MLSLFWEVCGETAMRKARFATHVAQVLSTVMPYTRGRKGIDWLLFIHESCWNCKHCSCQDASTCMLRQPLLAMETVFGICRCDLGKKSCLSKLLALLLTWTRVEDDPALQQIGWSKIPSLTPTLLNARKGWILHWKSGHFHCLFCTESQAFSTSLFVAASVLQRGVQRSDFQWSGCLQIFMVHGWTPPNVVGIAWAPSISLYHCMSLCPRCIPCHYIITASSDAGGTKDLSWFEHISHGVQNRTWWHHVASTLVNVDLELFSFGILKDTCLKHVSNEYTLPLAGVAGTLNLVRPGSHLAPVWWR